MSQSVKRRSEALYAARRSTIDVRTNRIFAGLLLCQWIAAVLCAEWITPYTWAGASSSMHFHVWTTCLVGGLITLFPIFLVVFKPDSLVTRMVIASAQMMYSALLIDVTGGRLETHFHVFGSLAFLAFYRDWRVFMPAILVTTLDHGVRGYLWPMSVFGTPLISSWRWVEHAAWVLFECAFLIPSCIWSNREMQDLALQQSQLEAKNDDVHQDVQRRTAELQQANVLLEESESRSRLILENAAEGIITIDERGAILQCNPAAAQMFGYEPAGLVGQKVNMLMPLHHAKRHDGYLANRSSCRQIKMLGSDRGLMAVRADKSEFPVEIAVSEARVGNHVALTAIIRDLTERRRREAERTQAQKLESVGQLAAGIAHEINTPTQYVGDNTRFLQDSFQQVDAVLGKLTGLLAAERNQTVTEELLADIEATLRKTDLKYLTTEIPLAIEQSLEGLQRVSTIVRAMKQFSHPGSDAKTPIDLNESLRTTATVARNEWRYVADMVFEFDDDLPPVPCLPDEMNQVWLNLIVNAAQAVEEAQQYFPDIKGNITISTRVVSGCAEVRIKDSGSGIPDTIRDRIFDPFFTTKPVGKGTGQGLAIVRNVVVNKHGGTIDLASKPGLGTTFTIRLPLESPDASGESSTSHEPTLSATSERNM